MADQIGAAQDIPMKPGVVRLNSVHDLDEVVLKNHTQQMRNDAAQYDGNDNGNQCQDQYHERWGPGIGQRAYLLYWLRLEAFIGLIGRHKTFV